MNDKKHELPLEREQRVHWTVEADSDDDLAQRYDAWAVEYDADLEEVDGWAAPRFTADVFDRFANSSWKILDAGAGTGWVGRELQKLGYGEIHGVDYSMGMLAKATEKNVYASLERANLNERLLFQDNEFDGVICVGTLTYVEPSCLKEFLRITRPGGIVVFSAQPKVHDEKGFLALQKEMEAQGLWSQEFLSEEMQPLPRSFPEVRFKTTVLRVS